jgi:hypothetical protein
VLRAYPILSHLRSLRAGQEVASSSFGSHQGVALARTHLQPEEKFPSHRPFSDLLLSGLDLKGTEYKEGRSQELRRKKKSLCALSSTHIALAV